jgi:hypothetical protein
MPPFSNAELERQIDDQMAKDAFAEEVRDEERQRIVKKLRQLAKQIEEE